MKNKLSSFIQTEKRIDFLLFLTGIIFSYAFAPYYWIVFAPICLSFLFWALNKNISACRLFGRAFSFGFGFGAYSTAWIAQAILLEGSVAYILIPLAWAGMGLLFGLFYGVPALFCRFYTIGWKRLLGWSAFFTLFEWVRSWFLTGFPWNLTGSIWENILPILQSASVWGVYGLSLITLLTCSTLAFWPQKKPILLASSFLILIALCGETRLLTATNDTVWGIQLRLVQPNIPQTLKWDPNEADASFAKIRRLSRQNSDSITHIIWPESAISFFVNQDAEERSLMMQALHQGATLITGGLRALPPRDAANSLFVLDDFANILTYYDKSHLVPFGEYVPFREILPLDKLVPLSFDFVSGQGVQTLKTSRTPAFGPLICYEVIFSGQVVNKQKRPEWLVNVTNDGWYGISDGPYQHLGMAKMRAVEEGLPLVRVANTGISAVFDGYGRTLGQTQLGTEAILDTRLPVSLAKTPYARYGIWIPLLLVGFILIFLWFKRK